MSRGLSWLKALVGVSVFYGITLLCLFRSHLPIPGPLAEFLLAFLCVPGIFIAMQFGGAHSGAAFIWGAVLNWFMYILIVGYFLSKNRIWPARGWWRIQFSKK